MSVDLEEMFRYPTRGDDVIKRFGIGGGIPALLAAGWAFVAFLSLVIPFFGLLNLFLAPIGIVAGLFLTGYYVRVARATYAGGADPPGFEDWTALLRDGGYGFLIGLVYAIPIVVLAVVGVILFILLIGGGAALGSNGGESAVAALGVVSVLGFGLLFVLYLVYSLVVGYLYPLSLCVYADTGDLRAAFSLDRIVPVAKTSDYAVPWLAQAGILFVVQSIVGALTVILIGYLLYPLLPFVTFFLSTAAFHAFARAYDEHVGAGTHGVESVGGGSPATDEDGTAV